MCSLYSYAGDDEGFAKALGHNLFPAIVTSWCASTEGCCCLDCRHAGVPSIPLLADLILAQVDGVHFLFYLLS